MIVCAVQYSQNHYCMYPQKTERTHNGQSRKVAAGIIQDNYGTNNLTVPFLHKNA